MTREERKELWEIIVRDLEIVEIYIKGDSEDFFNGVLNSDVTMITNKRTQELLDKKIALFKQYKSELTHNNYCVDLHSVMFFYTDYKLEGDDYEEYKECWTNIYSHGEWKV